MRADIVIDELFYTFMIRVEKYSESSFGRRFFSCVIFNWPLFRNVMLLEIFTINFGYLLSALSVRIILCENKKILMKIYQILQYYN